MNADCTELSTPLLQDYHHNSNMNIDEQIGAASSVNCSADRWSHPRGSAFSFVTRKLEDTQKPLLALMMERTVGDAMYRATTTKDIFETVRLHAAALGAGRPEIPSYGSVENNNRAPSPTAKALDWYLFVYALCLTALSAFECSATRDECDESGSSLAATASKRLRSDAMQNDRKKSGAVQNEEAAFRSSHHITRLVRYRDIDRLSPLELSLDAPAFLVRRHAVLLLLDPLRAVIMADRFVLIVPQGADNILSILNAYIAGWPCRKTEIDYSSEKESGGYVPFEYLVYEAVLETVISVQNQEFLACAENTRAILHSIKDASLISLKKQEQLAFYKNQIASKLSRCRQHRRALEELMDDDDALALMNLSRLRHNPSLYSVPLSRAILKYHEDAEALFDSYQIEFSSLETKIQLLKEEFHNAEDLASLRLATSQNKLLFAESIIILSTVFLTIGAFFGGLFGMNLKNHYEESDWAFGYVVAISILFIMFGTYSVYYYFRGNGTYPKIFDAAYFNFGCWNIED